MAKKVQVTSVTPAIKVKATSKARQDRTRKAIGVAVGGLPAVAAMAIMNRKKDSKKPTSKEISERTRMVAKVKRTAELVAPFAKPKTGMTTSKPTPKKTSNGSNTKPFNVRLIKPEEIIRDKPKATVKPNVKVTKKKSK